MMMIFRGRCAFDAPLLMLLQLVFVAACTSTQVENHLPEQERTYRSFAIDDGSLAPPPGFDPGASEAYPLVLASIANELTDKGYVHAREPDAVVVVREGIKSEKAAGDGYATGPGAIVDVPGAEGKVVKLVVALTDSSTGEVVWRCNYKGPAKRFVGSLERKVRKAVGRCMAQLPNAGGR
jgi:Domain of unknown function (DUF4136)